MGFEIRVVIVRGHDDELYAALQELPAVIVRKLEPPFEALIAAQVARDADELRERFPQLSFDEDDEAQQERLYEVLHLEDYVALSRRMPDVKFGLVHVDCFGGTCINDAEVRKAGEVIWSERGQSAHQSMFGQLGLPADSWYFAPFTRDFFDGGEPPAERARPITCVFKGELEHASITALTIAVQLMELPWRISIADSRNLIVVYGDNDIALSFNSAGDDVTIGGRSHIAAEDTERALAELCEEIEATGADYKVTLSEFGGKHVRTFEG